MEEPKSIKHEFDEPRIIGDISDQPLLPKNQQANYIEFNLHSSIHFFAGKKTYSLEWSDITEEFIFNLEQLIKWLEKNKNKPISAEID